MFGKEVFRTKFGVWSGVARECKESHEDPHNLFTLSIIVRVITFRRMR
jgi:hypothetical protein